MAAFRELFEQAAEDGLDLSKNIILRDEAHLKVELIELARRTVGAAVLVAEAGRDLEVAVEARDHDQLLEHLRRLREGIELARMDAARHQVVARAFRAARGQDRGLELGEAPLDHAPPDRRNDPGPQQDLPVHLLAPEIEVAVAQADLLARVLLGVDLQRQHLGARSHLQRLDAELDLAARKVRVDRLRVALDDRAGHRDHALHAHRLELDEERAGDIDHALGQAEGVAQVDEQQLAVIALAVDPAREARGRAGVRKAQFATAVGAVRMHGVVPRRGNRA